MEFTDIDRGIANQGLGNGNLLEKRMIELLRLKFEKDDEKAVHRKNELVKLFQKVDDFEARGLLTRLEKYRSNDELSQLLHSQLSVISVNHILSILKQKSKIASLRLNRKANLEHFILTFREIIKNLEDEYGNPSGNYYITYSLGPGEDEDLEFIISIINRIRNNLIISRFQEAFLDWEVTKERVALFADEYKSIPGYLEEIAGKGAEAFALLNHYVLEGKIILDDSSSGVRLFRSYEVDFAANKIDLPSTQNMLSLTIELISKTTNLAKDIDPPSNNALKAYFNSLSLARTILTANNPFEEYERQKKLNNSDNLILFTKSLLEVVEFSIRIVKDSITTVFSVSKIAISLSKTIDETTKVKIIKDIDNSIDKVNKIGKALAIIDVVIKTIELIQAIKSGDGDKVLISSIALLGSITSTLIILTDISVASTGGVALRSGGMAGAAGIVGFSIYIVTEVVILAGELGALLKEIKKEAKTDAVVRLYQLGTELINHGQKFISAYTNYQELDEKSMQKTLSNLEYELMNSYTQMLDKEWKAIQIIYGKIFDQVENYDNNTRYIGYYKNLKDTFNDALGLNHDVILSSSRQFMVFFNKILIAIHSVVAQGLYEAEGIDRNKYIQIKEKIGKATTDLKIRESL